MNVTEMFGIGAPKVVPFKTKATCINPELVVGLELEIENCRTLPIDALDDLARRCNFKIETDGSLRGTAYEFISYPMRSDEALAATGIFLDTARYGPDNYSDRCSIHVHVNCTDLELEVISSVALLYTVFEEILFEYVGRNRDSNIYCIPWNQCRLHFDLIQRFLANGGDVLRGWSKYTALNLLPLSKYGTMEFRQMHGTADMNKITTWVNIIGSMFKVAKQTPLNNLITVIKELNTTSQYETFFNQVLAGQLPYNETYRQKMEEGVIFAKFTLMNMTEKAVIKPKPVKKVTKANMDQFLMDLNGEFPRPGGIPELEPVRVGLNMAGAAQFTAADYANLWNAAGVVPGQYVYDDVEGTR